eukprot:gene2353-2821_t
MFFSKNVCLLLFALLYFAVSTPVECAGIAEVLEESEINEETILSGQCDPNTTCEMKCPCGKSVFFDLTKDSMSKSRLTRRFSFASDYVQSIWKSMCSKRYSITDYVKSRIQIASLHLVLTNKFIFQAVSQKIKKYAKRIQEVLGKVFKKIYRQYQEICHGRKKINSTELHKLRRKFQKELKRDSKKFCKKFGVEDFKKIKEKATHIFDEMIHKIELDSFQYCPCAPFFKRAVPQKMPIAIALCAQACETASMDYEQNTLNLDSTSVIEYTDE